VSKFLKESWLVLSMSVVFALLLAGAEAAFKPKIDANRNAELERAARAVMPADVELEALAKTPVVVEHEEKTVFKCLGPDGQLVGWALVDSDFGFQDKIKLVVGLSPDGGTITGLKVVENAETPGLGNRIEEDGFSGQYEGLDATREVEVVKHGRKAEENQIDAITGATISSDAVTKIANEVVRGIRPKLEELR